MPLVCWHCTFWLPAPTAPYASAGLRRLSYGFIHTGHLLPVLLLPTKAWSFSQTAFGGTRRFFLSLSTWEQSAVLKQRRGRFFFAGRRSRQRAEITNPSCVCFQVENRKKGPGLGAQGKPNKRQSNETYRDAVRRVMFARYKELE